VIRARSWLKGTVAVDSSVDLTLAGQLTVDIVGIECSYGHAHGVMGNLRTLATSCGLHAKNEIKIFDETRVVQDFAQEHSTTDRSFPFSVYLPGTLAPSMEFEDTQSDGYCTVRYNLTARLGSGKLRGDEQYSCVADRTLTIIGEPLSGRKHPYALHPTCYPRRQSLELLNGGCLVLAARVENTHLGKGSMLEFSIACRNFSKYPIQQIDVNLNEDVQWSTCSNGRLALKDVRRTQSRTKPIASYRNIELKSLIKECASEEQFLVASPSSTIVSWSEDAPAVSSLTLAEIHNDLLKPCNSIRMHIPGTAMVSYSGTLLKVSHSIQVDVVVRNRSVDTSFSIPIKIFDPPMESSFRYATTASEQVRNTMATTAWQDNAPAVLGH
jgi:hypothetical protein